MLQKNFSFKIKFYIFFLFLVLFFVKFSTTYVYAKTFKIENIEIAKPYDINFNKKEIFDQAFVEAFKELIAKITISEDSKKINTKNLKLIKSLVESFTITDEKFIKKNYIAKFNVDFSKKEVLEFLEKKNIFPSVPKKKKLLLLPILVDLKKSELLLFSENVFYKSWQNEKKKYYLLDYVLPNEDIDDLNIIRKNISNIEDYDFQQIVSKYELKDFIIIIIFKNDQNLKILSKVKINNNLVVSNQFIENIDLKDSESLIQVISLLKLIYENHWRKLNQINTSIKLPINIYLNSKNYNLINRFEKLLDKIDLVSNYYINSFSNEKTEFKIIFNGAPDKFIKDIENNGFYIDTSLDNWVIK